MYCRFRNYLRVPRCYQTITSALLHLSTRSQTYRNAHTLSHAHTFSYCTHTFFPNPHILLCHINTNLYIAVDVPTLLVHKHNTNNKRKRTDTHTHTGTHVQACTYTHTQHTCTHIHSRHMKFVVFKKPIT